MSYQFQCICLRYQFSFKGSIGIAFSFLRLICFVTYFCCMMTVFLNARPITKKLGLGRSFFRNVVFVACMKDISPCISKYFENFSKFLIAQSCQICFNNKSMASARKIYLREEPFGYNNLWPICICNLQRGRCFNSACKQLLSKINGGFFSTDKLKILGLRYCTAYKNKDFLLKKWSAYGIYC